MSKLIDEDISTIQAKYEAQKIAFAPSCPGGSSAERYRDIEPRKKKTEEGNNTEEVAAISVFTFMASRSSGGRYGYGCSSPEGSAII
jgi:hypothetical protein